MAIKLELVDNSKVNGKTSKGGNLLTSNSTVKSVFKKMGRRTDKYNSFNDIHSLFYWI